MMKSKRIVLLLIALCVIGFLFTIADYLALHDIMHDYVSTQVLDGLNITLSNDLPEWTSTKGEWQIVRISYLYRSIFFIICIYALYWMVYRDVKK